MNSVVLGIVFGVVFSITFALVQYWVNKKRKK